MFEQLDDQLHRFDPSPVFDAVDPKLKDALVIQDRYEGPINLLDNLKTGERLPQHGLRQLDHVFDLAKYTLPKGPKRDLVDQGRDKTFELLAENDVARLIAANPPSPDKPGLLTYKELDVPIASLGELMREEQRSIIDDNRELPSFRLKQFAEERRNSIRNDDLHPALQKLKDAVDHPGGKPPIGYLTDASKEMTLEEKLQHDIDLINESKGLHYYTQSGNRPTGSQSYMEPPKPVREIKSDFPTQGHPPNVWNYTEHAFEGKGRDVRMKAKDLAFDTKSEGFQKNLFENRQFNTAYRKFLETGEPQPININTIELQTHDPMWQQDVVLGKVKMQMQGYIQKDPKGNPVFMGTVHQGNNSEVYTFPKGNRGWWKERATDIGRASGLTQFRTIIEGDRPLWINLPNSY